MSSNPNYYELLGVSPSADPEAIKAAYRNLTKVAHPDRGGNEALFTMINEAYRTLSDTTRRSEYDRSLVTAPPPRSAPTPPPRATAPPTSRASAWAPPIPESATPSPPPFSMGDYSRPVPSEAQVPDDEFAPVPRGELARHLGLVAVAALGWYLFRATGTMENLLGSFQSGGDIIRSIETFLGPPVQWPIAAVIATAAVAGEWRFGLAWHLLALRPGLVRGAATGFTLGVLFAAEYIVTMPGLVLVAALAVGCAIGDLAVSRLRHR